MKFVGKIGFWDEEIEVSPGVYRPNIVERPYTGDLLVNSRRFQDQENSQNDHIKINNRISILADLYMQDHIQAVRYVEWKSCRWQVTSMTIAYPRIELEIGEEYHVANADDVTSGSGKYPWC